MNPVELLELAESGVRVKADPFISLLRKVGNRKLNIVTINGKTRSGKSFLMSCFTHFLNPNQSEGWLTSMRNDGQSSFKWIRGVDAETKGICFWPDPFIVKDSSGQDVAIILMDCQGAFDRRTTSPQNSLIFACSVLLSSTFIYNIKGVITEDEIDPFVVYLSSALRAMSCTGESKTFQNFIMLLRDTPIDFNWGLYTQSSCPPGSTNNLFTETLQPTEATAEVMQSRKIILQSFENTSAFALRHPGPGIRNDDISNLEQDFVDSTNALMNYLFGPRNLVVKSIEGNPVTGSQFIPYFQAMVSIFNENKLPRIDSFFKSVAERENGLVKQEALLFFNNKMRQYTATKYDGVPDPVLQTEFARISNETKNEFNIKIVMGGTQLINNYKTQLDGELTQAFQRFSISNTEKVSAKINRDRLAAEQRAREEAVRRQREAERIAAEQRAQQARAREQLINNAQFHVNNLEHELASARNRLAAVKQENYYYDEPVVTKHKTKVFGFNGSPYYTTSYVKRFNEGRYNADLHTAKEAVRIAEESVANAKAHLNSL